MLAENDQSRVLVAGRELEADKRRWQVTCVSHLFKANPWGMRKRSTIATPKTDESMVTRGSTGSDQDSRKIL
jgi:hypothetical protein